MSVQRSKSTESTASLALPPERIGSNESAIYDYNGFSIDSASAPSSFFDCTCVLIHDKKHGKYALSPISHKRDGLFLPFRSTYKASFNEQADYLCKSLLKTGKYTASYEQPRGCHTLRIQVPGIRHFVTRYTFYTTLTSGDSDSLKHLTWRTRAEMEDTLHLDMWSSDPITFASWFDPGGKHESVGMMTEFTVKEIKKMIQKTSNPQPSQAVFSDNNIKEDEILKIFTDYLQHTWPALGMSLKSFKDYMIHIKFFGTSLNQDTASFYFRSFAFRSMEVITFKELSMGLAITARDAPTSMSNMTKEIRANYVFRYYATTIDDTLKVSRKGIETLYQDSGKSEEEAKKLTLDLFEKSSFGEAIDHDNFIRAIAELKITGTSSCIRGAHTMRPYPFVYRQIDETVTSYESMIGRAKPLEANRCDRCRTKNYSNALHAYVLGLNQMVLESLEFPVNTITVRTSKLERKLSRAQFNDSLPTVICNLMRDFAILNGIYKVPSRSSQPRDYLKVDKDFISKLIFDLCDMVHPLFLNEDRIVKVNSPCMVFGDIHGNIHDLLLYEKQFWPKGASLEPYNFLFLGDYVDRGIYSLECILYLFAMKILSPKTFHLLRGNHEVKTVNRTFSFLRELDLKFGQELAFPMWERINAVFDCIPLVGVIDERIFCCHGGVPSMGSDPVSLEDISKLPNPMENPDEISLAWQILWNDPISDSDFLEVKNLATPRGVPVAYDTGFAFNTKRGTGYYYSHTAVRNFLDKNQLQFVIRAHECIPNGYEMKHQGQTITVFSSSRYSGGNAAAVMIVDKNKVRAVKIDTETGEPQTAYQQ